MSSLLPHTTTPLIWPRIQASPLSSYVQFRKSILVVLLNVFNYLCCTVHFPCPTFTCFIVLGGSKSSSLSACDCFKLRVLFWANKYDYDDDDECNPGQVVNTHVPLSPTSIGTNRLQLHCLLSVGIAVLNCSLFPFNISTAEKILGS